MIVLAFKFGTYSKISEFCRFFQQLDHSLHRRILKSHYILNDIVYGCDSWNDICMLLDTIEKDYLDLDVSSLKQNRDFSIIPYFSNGSSQNLLRWIHGNVDFEAVLLIIFYSIDWSLSFY